MAPSSERLRLYIAPSSERWSWCWICIPLSEEVDCGCLAKGLPLLCEVVSCVASCKRLYWLERGVVNSRLYCPKFSVEVPCVGVLCGQVGGLKILLGEGGNVELGARTSKQISLFAFDPLTLTLSLYIVPLHHFIFILYAWLVCVCLTCA